MILVTGATGLLGSHLLVQLMQMDDTTSLLAAYRNRSKQDEVERVFVHYCGAEIGKRLFSKITWVELDLLDVHALDQVMKGVKQVYHCAGFISFNRKDFDTLLKINREGTANVVNACLTHSIDKLVHVSSTSAVGKVLRDQRAYVSETNKWDNAQKVGGYALSKYTGEKEVWRGVEEGLSALVINPSVLIGAGSWKEGSMAIFDTVRKGLLFYTSGTNAFVDARDVARAMILLMDSKLSGERFLCTGHNVSFRDLFGELAHSLRVKGPRIKASKGLSKLGWLGSSLIGLFTGKSSLTRETIESASSVVIYDSSKLMEVLDFKFIPLKESIQNAVDFQQKNG